MTHWRCQQQVKEYLSSVLEGSLPLNHEVNSLLQEVLNLMPNLSVEVRLLV